MSVDSEMEILSSNQLPVVQIKNVDFTFLHTFPAEKNRWKRMAEICVEATDAAAQVTVGQLWD